MRKASTYYHYYYLHSNGSRLRQWPQKRDIMIIMSAGSNNEDDDNEELLQLLLHAVSTVSLMVRSNTTQYECGHCQSASEDGGVDGASYEHTYTKLRRETTCKQ